MEPAREAGCYCRTGAHAEVLTLLETHVGHGVIHSPEGTQALREDSSPSGQRDRASVSVVAWVRARAKAVRSVQRPFVIAG